MFKGFNLKEKFNFKEKINFQPPSMPRRKIDIKLDDFNEQRDISEQKSIELSERAKKVTKRIKELKKGINMLPEDLPTEFKKAIDNAIESVREDIHNEANDIADEADIARAEADDTLYNLRKESERLSKKAKSADFICSIPLVGVLGDKGAMNVHSILEELYELSQATNECYESLLCSRNMAKDVVK